MIRRNFVDLSDAERMQLAAAFNHVNATGTGAGMIKEYAKAHSDFFDRGIHWRPQFLPWHRYFLRKLELALQEYDPTVMLPYWDWTQDNSRSLEISPWKEIFGDRMKQGGKFDQGWLFIRAAAGSGSLPGMDDILRELDAMTFAEFRGIESGSHIPAHNWVGGSMAGSSSPLDPLFYLHHCNLDRLWSIWQLNHPNAGQYDAVTAITGDDRAGKDAPYVELNEKMPAVGDDVEKGPESFSGATPLDMLDHRSLGYFAGGTGYTYQQDTVLEEVWQAKNGLGIKTHHE